MKKIILNSIAVAIVALSSNQVTGQITSPQTPYEQEVSSKIIYQNNDYVKMYKNTTDSDFRKCEIYNAENILIGGNIVCFINNKISIFNTEGVLLEEHVTPSVEQVNAYPGDCNQLGGLRKGEEYGDCFSRNWSNFCCDFLGCATQVSSPYLVAAAIGLSCLVLEKPRVIDIFEDNINIYDKQ